MIASAPDTKIRTFLHLHLPTRDKVAVNFAHIQAYKVLKIKIYFAVCLDTNYEIRNDV